MPYLPLAEITLPAPEAVPPIVLPMHPASTSTPLDELPRATVPETSVPILFPATTLEFEPSTNLDAIVAVPGNDIALVLNRRAA